MSHFFDVSDDQARLHGAFLGYYPGYQVERSFVKAWL
jgi:hypothetical protein